MAKTIQAWQIGDDRVMVYASVDEAVTTALARDRNVALVLLSSPTVAERLAAWVLTSVLDYFRRAARRRGYAEHPWRG